MKKVLLSLFVAIAIAIPVSAASYKAADRVPTVGQTLLNKNGIVSTNVKFQVAAGIPDNSNYATNRTVNISDYELKYAGNDNEVAAIVANELGHIISGHASKDKFVGLLQATADPSLTMSNSPAASLASNYKFTKEEKEADVIAINLMANAGYNPLAIIVVLTKQTGTYWETLQGKPANAQRAMNAYDYIAYAYPAKLKAGYGCNEYKNFLNYANSVLVTRKESKKLTAKNEKEMKKARKNSVNTIAKFRTRGGLSGWDAAYGLLNGSI